LAIRLQSLGFDTTVLEKHDQAGGPRLCPQDGYTFDMGPTVITVPHFIEELFALQRDAARAGPARRLPRGDLGR
jgi:phytoene desaturase